MRISITDRCNLRCKYCMPNGITAIPMEEILSYEEIITIVRAASELGISHIKVTGGEPLVRRGCCELIHSMKQIPGIEKVTITTNGVLLNEYLEPLIAAGIDGINISLDTLDRSLYQQITGADAFDLVMSNIQKAAESSIPVKLNAVSLDFSNTNLIQLARDYAIDVRFIEMMPIGNGKNFESIDHKQLLSQLETEYPDMKCDHTQHGYGPAVYYKIPGYKGSIGLISAIHGKFCGQCNRIRLTSQGYLKTCLCYEDGVDLRTILRKTNVERIQGKECESGQSKVYGELRNAFQEAIDKKPRAHCFENPELISEVREMSKIGG